MANGSKQRQGADFSKHAGAEFEGRLRVSYSGRFIGAHTAPGFREDLGGFLIFFKDQEAGAF